MRDGYYLENAENTKSVLFHCSCIRGYHEYQSVWQAALSEMLKSSQEVGNRLDVFAVAVVKVGETVEHLAIWTYPSFCSTFLRNGGKTVCEVTGLRRHLLEKWQIVAISALLLFSRWKPFTMAQAHHIACDFSISGCTSGFTISLYKLFHSTNGCPHSTNTCPCSHSTNVRLWHM